MTAPRHQPDEELLAALDKLLGGVDLPGAVRVARSYLAVLERRLKIATCPLDLFTLPHDLPKWDELYADLVARAIKEAGTIAKAAEVIGKSRSTLYVQLNKGLLDANAADDPSLAALLVRLLGTEAPGGGREAEPVDCGNAPQQAAG
ncbi:MAG TPA: hypothetical protein VFH61_12465 [Thermoleophilia bacterium]|nr:hypothetical protein [Thermoleophilia bacterium]